MRSDFLNVFRSKNENLEKKISNVFFCLGGHFDQPQKFLVALARSFALMCGEYYLGEVGANSNVY